VTTPRPSVLKTITLASTMLGAGVGFAMPAYAQTAIPVVNDTAIPDRTQDLPPSETPETSNAPVDLYSPSIVPPRAMPAPAPVQNFGFGERDLVPNLVDRVGKAVVNIIVTTDDGQTTSEGQGSGFIIDPSGVVVTNYHVIEGGDHIEIQFNNGESYPASIVGTDAETDLAVVQIEADRRFKSVNFHKGQPIRIGQWVVAIGNPFGIGQSTSLGVISAIGRERVDSGAYVDYIQTDATINRGNSGGPLFNLDGDVIGVNSAIYSPTGASVGIAFVIPHYTARDIVRAIRNDGKVRRGWLGVGLRTAEYDRGQGVYQSGATINNIVPGSPAQIYGLEVDDVILNINGETVRDSIAATRVIGALRPGDVATFTYERGEETFALDLSIAERPEKNIVEENVSGAASGANPAPRPQEAVGSGLSLVDLSSSFRNSIGMRSDQVGVYVENVTPGSPAARKGFKSDMVILEADNEPVASVQAFRSKLAQAKKNGSSSLFLKVRLQNGSENFVSLPI